MREEPPRPARLIDIAQAAGVSVATVSNVLNRPGKVGADTTERIKNVMRQMDYVPHDGAVRLRRGSSRSIGLVLPDVTNPFYAQLARGAADAAYGHRYTLVLCDSADDADREDGYLAMLAEQRAAGAVIAPLSAESAQLTRLRKRGIRLVVLDRLQPTSEGCSVAVDDVMGGRIAAQHLLELGHRDIALVNGPLTIQQCADRYEGAQSAVRTYRGARLRQLTTGAAMTTPLGLEAGDLLADFRDVPTAVFATNDLLAVGVIRALDARGLRVPDDVCVIGYGDLDVASYARTPLTTVAQPVNEMGRAAVELMMEEIDSSAGHVHRAQILPPRLVTRRSTGPRRGTVSRRGHETSRTTSA